MNEIGIILISHGHFAKYAMDSAEMIVGKQENYKVISVTDDKDLEDVLRELEDSYKILSKDREVIVLADIFGGTPCNATSRLILNRDRPIDEIKSNLERTYNETFIDISEMVLSKVKEEEIVL